MGGDLVLTTMTPDTLKESFLDVYKAVENIGYTRGHDEGVKAGHNKGYEQGRIDGAQAELKRIQAVEEQALPGHEALITQLKLDGKTSGSEAAVKILAAEKAKMANRLEEIKKHAPPPVPPSNTDGVAGATNSNLTVEERTKSAWDKDPAIRAEFTSYETFLAYTKAVDEGRVKILGKKL